MNTTHARGIFQALDALSGIIQQQLGGPLVLRPLLQRVLVTAHMQLNAERNRQARPRAIAKPMVQRWIDPNDGSVKYPPRHTNELPRTSMAQWSTISERI